VEVDLDVDGPIGSHLSLAHGRDYAVVAHILCLLCSAANIRYEIAIGAQLQLAA
jgi:hypothetical protein